VNTRIRNLFGLVVVLFGVLIGFTSYWSVFDADELEAIVRGYEGYDAAATLAALPDGLPVLLVAAAPQPDQVAAREPLLQRFAELVPRGTTSHVDVPHDVVWGLGPALGDLVADWLEAENLR